MTVNKRSSTPLLLAGLAAFAFYKYKKMSPQRKNELKEKGMDLVDKYVPQSVKNMFGKESTTSEPA